jgi:hypothetical protein
MGNKLDERFLVIAAASIVLVIILAFIIFPSAFSPAPQPSIVLLREGDGSYATGSALNGTFALLHTAILTGAFVTNASATVKVQQSSWPSNVDECQKPTLQCYTTGDVNRATINATLLPGNYRLTVIFTNDTTVQTWFNVTQSLGATYQKS